MSNQFLQDYTKKIDDRKTQGKPTNPMSGYSLGGSLKNMWSSMKPASMGVQAKTPNSPTLPNMALSANQTKPIASGVKAGTAVGSSIVGGKELGASFANTGLGSTSWGSNSLTGTTQTQNTGKNLPSYQDYLNSTAKNDRRDRKNERNNKVTSDTKNSATSREGLMSSAVNEINKNPFAETLQRKQSIEDEMAALKADYAKRTSGLNVQGMDLAAKSGEGKAIQDNFQMQMDALTNKLSQTESQLSAEQSAYSTKTGALQNLASLQTSSPASYGQTVFNPATGQYEDPSGSGSGSMNPQQNAQTFAQQIMSGAMTYEQAVSSLGYAGNAGKTFLDQAIINAGGRPLDLQSRGEVAQSNILTGGGAGGMEIPRESPFYLQMQRFAEAMVKGQYSGIPQNVLGDRVLAGQLLNMAREIDPNFNPNTALESGNIQSQSTVVQKDFDALNTTFDLLEESFNDLPAWARTGMPIVNMLTQNLSKFGISTAEIQRWQTMVRTARTEIASLVASAGGMGVDMSGEAARFNIDENSTPQQVINSLRDIRNIAQQKIDAMRQQTGRGSTLNQTSTPSSSSGDLGGWSWGDF